MERASDSRFIVLVYCPECGAPVSSTDDSCRNCHAAFSKGSFCSHCGEHVDEATDVCGSCGAAFTTFYEYECPDCKRGISESTRSCPNCSAKFFKPLKRRINRSNAKKVLHRPKETIERPPSDGIEAGVPGIEAKDNAGPAEVSEPIVTADAEVKIPNMESTPQSKPAQVSPIATVDAVIDQKAVPEPADLAMTSEKPKKGRILSFLGRRRKSVQADPAQEPAITGPASTVAVPESKTEEATVQPAQADVPPPATNTAPEPVQAAEAKKVPDPPPPLPLTQLMEPEPQSTYSGPRRGRFFLHLASQNPVSEQPVHKGRANAPPKG